MSPMARPCKAPGCDRITEGAGIYCSQSCKFVARQIRAELKHDRAMFEAASCAPLAERCKGCEGGYFGTDEINLIRCGCGRIYEPEIGEAA